MNSATSTKFNPHRGELSRLGQACLLANGGDGRAGLLANVGDEACPETSQRVRPSVLRRRRKLTYYQWWDYHQ